jgi:F-type H+-transporting ATPase subunit b
MDALFSTFGINWKLLLMQGFNFALLLVVLWWFLYRPVLKIIDERKMVIEKGVKDAENAQEKLSLAEDEGKEIILKASHASESMFATARSRAEEKSASILEEARAKIEAERKDARLKTEAEAQAIRQASEKEIARAAVLAAEKILSKQT